MLEPGAAVVIGLFAATLYVIHGVSPRLTGGREAGPWWRRATFWASFVAVAQILVYALFS